MKKTILAIGMLLGLVLAACSSTTPTAEVIVVTATPEAVAPTQVPPTEVPVAPTPDDGNPAVFLALISPGNGSAWESTDFVEVTGSARGQPSDDVVVFFIDEGRNIYGYACAQLGAPNANDIKTYSTRMTAPVNVDTAGKIIAANIDAAGGIAGSAGVFATALKDNNDRHVTIEEPGNRCVIVNPSSFTVEGSAQGAFENNVVVQAQDASGNVLAEAVTTYSSGSVGGPGAWTVTLSVNVAAGAEGKLVAFSPDPAGGAPLSSRTYTVFYGE
jgi:hypothetical protein